jgi:hypothetical protein
MCFPHSLALVSPNSRPSAILQVLLAAAHLNHPSAQICSSSWSMLSLLTPFYVPAELRPNFSMQALLGRFRAALLDTDLVMRRHQAGEIRYSGGELETNEGRQ